MEEINLQEYKQFNQKIDNILNKKLQPKKITQEMFFLQLIYPLVYRLRNRAEPLTYKEIIDHLELEIKPEDLINKYRKAEKKLILKNYSNLLVLTKNSSTVPSYIETKSICTDYDFSVILNTQDNLKYAIKLDELHSINTPMGQLIAKRIMYWYHISDRDIIEKNSVDDKMYEYLLNNANFEFFNLYNKLYDKIITTPQYL